MPCSPDLLRSVPLFSNLDDDEVCVLARQVDLGHFAARQRIFRTGDPADRAYVLLSGRVRVTALDEDQQEVVLHEPKLGELFGFASMMEQTPHQAEATATQDSACIESGAQRPPHPVRAKAPRGNRPPGVSRPPGA